VLTSMLLQHSFVLEKLHCNDEPAVSRTEGNVRLAFAKNASLRNSARYATH
jgi:hypothetical protein